MDTKETAKAKTPAADPRELSHRLVAGTETLTLLATKLPDGTYRTEAVHRASKAAKNVRGATQVHKDLAAARITLDRMVQDAKKNGWQVPTGKGGFRRPADQFTALPRPGAAKK